MWGWVWGSDIGKQEELGDAKKRSRRSAHSWTNFIYYSLLAF